MARLDKRVAAAVLLVAALATHISLQNLAQAGRDEGKKEEGRKAIDTKDADQEIEENNEEESVKKSCEEVGAADAAGSNNEEKSDSEVSESETKAAEFVSLASGAAAAAALATAAGGAAAFESESDTKANSESEEESEGKTESEMQGRRRKTKAVRTIFTTKKKLFALALSVAALTPTVTGFAPNALGLTPAMTRGHTSGDYAPANTVPSTRARNTDLRAGNGWFSGDFYNEWAGILVDEEPPAELNLNLADPLESADPAWNPEHISAEIREKYEKTIQKTSDSKEKKRVQQAASFAEWVERKLDEGWKKHTEAVDNEFQRNGVAPSVKANLEGVKYAKKQWKDTYRNFVADCLKVAQGLPQEIKLSVPENDLPPALQHLSSSGSKRTNVKARSTTAAKDEDVVVNFHEKDMTTKEERDMRSRDKLIDYFAGLN